MAYFPFGPWLSCMLVGLGLRGLILPIMMFHLLYSVIVSCLKTEDRVLAAGWIRVGGVFSQHGYRRGSGIAEHANGIRFILHDAAMRLQLSPQC